ncbi:MAG: heavy metal translocating P-type ATPase [Planctomycetes bacterium]|nr:heavy metal translocating P-type ATPase [Planctomycetota bacterium]MCB9910746.1 heavy metal translocating P-type ATPase [Planctomycetota bacterium]MCB9912772.1 heavy metal translocating P-type ATPase [Planctomycetota bacterium]
MLRTQVKSSKAQASESKAREASACDHCGLPVPANEASESGERQFCCSGCRTVYHAIHGSGLEAFYRLAKDGSTPVAARTTGRAYEEFGDGDFLACYAQPLPEGLLSIELYLEGVHCASCIWLVERLPHILPGVVHVRLHARRHVAHITWDPTQIDLPTIARRLDSFGYPVHPYRGAEIDRIQKSQDRQHLARIGVAGALAGNVMLLAFALYGGHFSGMDPRYARLIRVTSFLLTVLAVVWPGRVFLRGAWSSLRARSLHMDVPVALALLVGTAWGGFNAFTGQGEVYFESLTAVIFLLLLGRWIQFRQQRVASDAVELLFSLTPTRTRRWDGASFVEVPVAALRTGDKVQVLPSETLPADGVVDGGSSTLNCATLTGESRPVEVGFGDEVFAGTTNLSAPLVLRIVRTGIDTRVGSLMRLVEQGAQERPPMVRAADRLAHYFVLAVILLAAGTALGWWLVDPSRAAEQTVALLIVTCPCALGLATPLAFQAAIGRAARSGILIKNGEALERLARPGQLLVDKTGTLTTSNMRLVDWFGDRSWQAAVRALEAQVAHPISQALVQSLAADAEPPVVDSIQSELGHGVQGRVDGRSLRVGSAAWILAGTTDRPGWLDAAMAATLAKACTPVVVSVDDRIVALAGVGDPTHPDAVAAIAELEAMGWVPKIVSGDHPEVVQAVARELGLAREQAVGNLTPEDKLGEVRRAREQGPVVMVGDGTNDAAALSAADCGVAVQGGAEASLRAADAFLTEPGIGALVELMRGAQRTMAVVRRNFRVSIAYNAITATGAVMGWIHPLLAAALMPISSLTVVMLSYRSHTFAKRKN